MAVAPEIADLVHRLGAGKTDSFTPEERAAARTISKHVGIRKDAGNNLIIAWFPWAGDGGEGDTFAESLALPGGVAKEDLHLTLLYLGKTEDFDLDLVAAALKLFTATRCWPLDGEVAGVGRFVGEDDTDILVGLIDSVDLNYFRDALRSCLSELGIWCSDSHGYLPHITLAYTTRMADTPHLAEKASFTIASLAVAAGGARAQFDFPGGIPDDDPRPFLCARRAVDEAVAKAGKVLSAKNLKLVKDAASALEALIASAVKEEATPATKFVDMPGTDEFDEPEMTHYITKAVTEERYTFGPLYAPSRKDAHGEFTDAETLQKAVWEYVQESAEDGRRIRLQHDDSEDPVTVGEWLEVVAWPYETTVKMTVPGEAERELVMPAGTVYLGVKWDEDAWDAIKSRKLTGYSMGGKAVRASFPDLDLEHMGDKIAASMHEFEASAKDAKLCGTCGLTMADGSHTSGDDSDTK